MEKQVQKAIPVKLLLLDVDGVLTDGKLYFSEQGDEIKAFNILDGLGIKLLQQNGIRVGIITGRNTALVARRAENLGITLIKQGREDKLVAMNEVLETLNLEPAEVAYMGDDLPDLPAILGAGLGMTVASAYPLVIEKADWCSSRKGGEGAVREACDFILDAQGKLETTLTPYLG